jgi:hypothetical protein
VLEDVKGASFRNVNAARAAGSAALVLMNVNGFEVRGSNAVADTKLDAVTRKEF